MNSVRIREAGDLALVCSTVALFCISFPGGKAPWLGWLAFAPLAVAIHGKSAREAFVVTAFTTFICWFAATWWLIPGVSLSAGTPFYITLLFESVFCLAYAIPYGVAGMLSAKMGWGGTVPGAIKTALAWTAICGLTPHILPGNLAHTQYRYPCMIQIVELGGMPMLLFCIYLVTWLCAAALVNLKKRLGYALSAVVLAGIIPAGIAVYGHLRLDAVRQQLAAPGTPRLTVGWVQPNFNIQSRSRNAWEDGAETVDGLTRDLARKKPKPDLIVWPEIPFPISYSGNADDRALVDRLVFDTNIPMLVTGYLQGRTEGGEYYNAAEFVRAPGRSQVYLKQHLLPFGEYLPGEKRFSFLRKMFPGTLKYIPGDGGAIFDLGGGIRLIPLICYEAIFPETVAEGRAMGGNLVINPVNDAWFGKSNGPEIHLALTLFRAVEFRIPVVRATNSGIGAVITAAGELDAESVTPLFERCAMTATVAVPPMSSPYAVAGDLFLWGCALGTVALLWAKIGTNGFRHFKRYMKNLFSR